MLNYDVVKLKNEKSETSTNIHKILLKNIKSERKYCKNCHKPLPWDFIYRLCDKCFSDNYS